MNMDQAHAMLAEVRANQAKLATCNSHNFFPADTKALVSRRYICTRCGGTVDSHGHYWYTLGRQHGAPT